VLLIQFFLAWVEDLTTALLVDVGGPSAVFDTLFYGRSSTWALERVVFFLFFRGQYVDTRKNWPFSDRKKICQVLFWLEGRYVRTEAVDVRCNWERYGYILYRAIKPLNFSSFCNTWVCRTCSKQYATFSVFLLLFFFLIFDWWFFCSLFFFARLGT